MTGQLTDIEKTKIRPVALLGKSIGYSLSPPMHNAAFRITGLPYFYFPLSFELKDLTKVVEAVKRLCFLGCNVTVPYKEKIIPCLDKLSPEAKECGSVNTIKNASGQLIGYSTDGQGFVRSCRFHGITLNGASILLLGAGGAAKSASFAAASAGAARIIISNRTLSKAKELVKKLQQKTPEMEVEACQHQDLSKSIVGEADLIINATSLGMKREDPVLIKADRIKSVQVVYDLVYSPIRTRIMEEAAKAGARSINGLAMLLFQGENSFRIWTGQEAPLKVMSSVLCRAAGLPEDFLKIEGNEPAG